MSGDLPAPDGEPWAALTQTHTSVVVLLGDRAYKVKKPVLLPFVDLSTRGRRWRTCRAEVRLNRRFAPEVYLGVQELRGDGPGRGEPVVVMRRMPVAARLSTLLQRGGPGDLSRATRCVDDVARRVAVVHAGQPGLAGERLWTTMSSLWAQGCDQLRPYAELVGPAELAEVAALAQEYLRGRRPLLDRRERLGLVRDGHGDLLADDVYALDGGARILDCLEFDARLRHGDVLADVAFLAMDLELRGAPELARRLLDAHEQYLGLTHPPSLEHHYVAYRAFVRAKVACLRVDQGDDAAREQARTLLRLALTHLRRGRVRLLLLGGLPGTGKSTLARALATRDDRAWVLLSSDPVRKELTGHGRDERCPAPPGGGIYTPRLTVRTYAELRRRAALALQQGLDVVLDASWSCAEQRQRARRLGAELGCAVDEVRCELPARAGRDRLARRAPGAAHGSDAGVAVRDTMAATFEPWPEAVPLRTDGPVGRAGDTLAALVG